MAATSRTASSPRMAWMRSVHGSWLALWHLGCCLMAPPARGRFLGFHLDDETCNNDIRFGNISTLEPPCIALLEKYSQWIGNLSGTGLTLSVDTGACAESTCFNLTWNGVSKRGEQHVIDIVNESVVMDYTRDAASAVSYEGRGAKWLLSYASTFTPPRQVRLGLAVRDPGANSTWWQADNISALDALMHRVQALASSFPSFDGLAVFHTELWWAASRAAAPKRGLLDASRRSLGQSWPARQNLAGWYIPPEAVFNGTYLQLDFLHWAKAANISVLYSQNWVGLPTSIPGVLNNTDAFCSFAQMAHRAGIDLQLFGALTDLARDLSFIANCEMPRVPQPIPPVPPPPSPCQIAIRNSCGTAQLATQGICRRCLLDNLPAFVLDAGCNHTDLNSSIVCAGAQPGHADASPCDKALFSYCGAEMDQLEACETCVIVHARDLVVGWGCGVEVQSWCDQQLMNGIVRTPD